MSPALNRLGKFAIFTLLLFPALVFLVTIWRYGANVPYWDDVTQILWMLNQFISSINNPAAHPAGNPDAMGALFYPNAGHIPMLTRLFGLLQYALGGMSFRVAMLVAGSFWVLAFFLVLVRAHKTLPLLLLAPLPFVAFSLSQWESMNMMLGGWQMYVGTLFFPLTTLLALIAGWPLLAGSLFALGLFDSAGALCVLPIAIGWYSLRKEWRALLGFLVPALPAIGFFLYINPASAQLSTMSTDILPRLYFGAAFLGNIYGMGSYDLTPLNWQHATIGSVVLLLGITGLYLNRQQPFFKLVFIYLILLAGMTALKRADQVWVVPRYSVFALLAVCTVYILWIDILQNRVSARVMQGTVLATTLLAILLWVQNYHNAIPLLALDHQNRTAALNAYIERGDTSGLLWNEAWCRSTLEDARRLGIYDYQQALQGD